MQRRALRYVCRLAQRDLERNASDLESLLGERAEVQRLWAGCAEHLMRTRRIVMHFHPDRITHTSENVLDALYACGTYKSQFETKTSNGGLTAYPGGQRDVWEGRLFGGHYTGVEGRPLYGALDIFGQPYGPAPRFGSCSLWLSTEVSKRSTFAYGDSASEPEHVGTWDIFEPVLIAFLRDIAAGRRALEVRPQTVATALEMLWAGHVGDQAAPCSLDEYVEVQIHGGVDCLRDVESLLLDSSFRNTPVERSAHLFCSRYNVDLVWCAGPVLPVSQIPGDLRGPELPQKAVEFLGKETLLTAARIGEVARDHRPHDPAKCAEFLQCVKYLWHILALCGNRATIS